MTPSPTDLSPAIALLESAARNAERVPGYHIQGSYTNLCAASYRHAIEVLKRETDGTYFGLPGVSTERRDVSPQAEPGKVMLSLEDLGALANTAERNGTQHGFVGIALQWAAQANAEIQRLRATRPPAVEAEPVAMDHLPDEGVERKCSVCGGIGLVEDEEIESDGSAVFENGPIKCMKDCQSCGGSGTTPSPPEGSTQLAAPLQQPQEGWVSVEERLPEKFVEVLVAFADSSLPSTGQYTANPNDHDGWCYPKENCDWADGSWPTVTHWRPLPDHPHEERFKSAAAPSQGEGEGR